jgi:hypothetical protein
MANPLITIPKDATKGSGGIDLILLAQTADVVATVDASGNASFTPDVSSSWIKIVPRKETADFADDSKTDIKNGSVVFDHKLEFVLSRYQQIIRDNIKYMGNSEWIAAVKDRNGQCWLLGSPNGLDMTTTKSGVGKAPADLNGATITLQGNQQQPAGLIDASTWNSIFPG